MASVSIQSYAVPYLFPVSGKMYPAKDTWLWDREMFTSTLFHFMWNYNAVEGRFKEILLFIIRLEPVLEQINCQRNQISNWGWKGIKKKNQESEQKKKYTYIWYSHGSTHTSVFININIHILFIMICLVQPPFSNYQNLIISNNPGLTKIQLKMWLVCTSIGSTLFHAHVIITLYSPRFFH